VANAGQGAEQKAQKEAAYNPGGVGNVHGLEWLFRRTDIPNEVKTRFFVWSDIKSLRLSNLHNMENVNTIISQLDLSISLYLSQRKREDNEITEKILDWLNQLKAAVRLNLMASLGESRDMELITKSRGEWKQEVEQKMPEEEGS